MTILREPQRWIRPRGPTRGNVLTAEEREHVRAAVRFLFRRFGGSWKALAAAMGANDKTIRNASSRRGAPTGMLAIQAARVVCVSVEDVLSGAWPKPGACPMCGRAG